MTVRRGDGVLARIVGRVAGLPPAMVDEPFQAAVGRDNVWTRGFGASPRTCYYSTTHGTARWLGAPRGEVLTEGIGGALDSMVQFGYTIHLEQRVGENRWNKSRRRQQDGDIVVVFKSAGLWLGGVACPAFWLPPKWWCEAPTARWRYAGSIRVPAVMGGDEVMSYGGNFVAERPQQAVESAVLSGGRATRRVVVVGGTGMLGTALCRQLLAQEEPVGGGGRLARSVHGQGVARRETFVVA